MARLIQIENICSVPVAAGLEAQALAGLAEALDPLFAERGEPDRSGLYIASDNAGAASSLAFWRHAQQVGVGLASPELFPYCLANAPCGFLARHFAIQGPSVTYTGQSEAWTAALEHAHVDLETARINIAFALIISFGEGEAIGGCTALRLTSDQKRTRLNIDLDQLEQDGDLQAATARLKQKAGF